MMIFLCYCANYETGKFVLNMDVLDLVDDRYIEEVWTAMSGSAEDVVAACDTYLREYWRIYSLELGCRIPLR